MNQVEVTKLITFIEENLRASPISKVDPIVWTLIFDS